MRTIKFRGKDVETGKWRYGYLGDGNWICDWNNNYRHSFEVKATTVGEFTGLLDKNRKEIYEGDIVEFVNVNLPDCVIVYDNGSFMYRELGEDISLEELRIQFTVEVIGNIHDNPELLKNIKK